MDRKVSNEARLGRRVAPRGERPQPSPKLTTPKQQLSKTQTTLVVGFACLGLGYAFEMILAPAVQAKMFPWAIGRSLGPAAIIELWGLVIVGLWFKSPYPRCYHSVSPSLVLRLHQALTSSGVVVLALHIVALLLDRYAGVGVLGAFIPGLSGYRRLGVAFGTIAL